MFRSKVSDAYEMVEYREIDEKALAFMAENLPDAVLDDQPATIAALQRHGFHAAADTLAGLSGLEYRDLVVNADH